MTIHFISRHPGAIAWIKTQALRIDQFSPHLDPQNVAPGDTVIGILPVNLAAQVCARGAAYWHLSLELPEALRGKELGAEALVQLGARLEAFEIISKGKP